MNRFSKILVILAWALLAPRPGHAVASLSPQPKILVIFADDNLYSGALTELSAMHLALDPLTPTQAFDAVMVKSATEPTGEIAPALSRGIAKSTTVTVAAMAFTGIPVSLSDYCQVWDLRFDNDTGQSSASSITSADATAYKAFLAGGGRMFLNGENAGYESRNNGLTQFLTDIGTGKAFVNPGSVAGTYSYSIFPPDPLNFSTILNNLTAQTLAPQVVVPGWYNVCGTCSGWGSSHPIAEYNNSGTIVATMFAFLPNELAAGIGRVMVAFDWNGFIIQKQAAGTGNNLIVYQNIYAWLGTCDTRYTISKTSNAPVVGSVRKVTLGSSYNYTICLQNTGTTVLSNVIYDTLPNCSAFVSSTPNPAGHTGQYYWWNAALGVGTGTCVTVTVQASSLGCP